MSTPLKRPCAKYVLWRKQQAGNIHIYNIYVRTKWINKKNKHPFVDLPILKCMHIYKQDLVLKNRPGLMWHHQHHVVPPARISLTLSHHFFLSFIASGRSSGLHPISSQGCCMCVRAGRPAFDWPYVGVHRSTSLMSSSLLLQQCPACLVRLTWIVFVMGGRWPYSWGLVGCCLLDLFNIARSILVSNCRLASSPAVLLASK